MTEKYDFELTQITLNNNSDRPSVYIEMIRGHQNYRRAKTPF